MDLDQLLGSSPALRQWLAGQSVACVLLVAWVLTLLRERTALRQRNDKLSDWLVRVIERGWQERYKQQEDSLLRYDSSMRNLLDHFSVIATKRYARDEPSGPSGHPMQTSKTFTPKT